MICSEHAIAKSAQVRSADLPLKDTHMHARVWCFRASAKNEAQAIITNHPPSASFSSNTRGGDKAFVAAASSASCTNRLVSQSNVRRHDAVLQRQKHHSALSEAYADVASGNASRSNQDLCQTVIQPQLTWTLFLSIAMTFSPSASGAEVSDWCNNKQLADHPIFWDAAQCLKRRSPTWHRADV